MSDQTYDHPNIEQAVQSLIHEDCLVLLRLRELRREGNTSLARELTQKLELRDRGDDWAMRWAM